MTTFVPYSVDRIAGVFPGYRVHHLIGAGGMGAVYQATQLSLERLVAIKILPPEFVRDPGLRALFEAEAKAMARLNHPNLIAVYDFGEAGDIPYIIMEYVHGCSLYHSAHGMAVHPDEAVRIMSGVCAGLAYAHQHEIIHCDIKPANILLNQQAQPKIGDFGLAKRSGQCARVGTPAFGSVHYSSPEVMQSSAHLDVRADVFSAGVVLHELLTGRYLMDDPRPASVIAACDVCFDTIIQRATMPDPAQRYSSIQEMADDLTAIRATSASSIPGTESVPLDPIPSASHRNPPIHHSTATASHAVGVCPSPKSPVIRKQWVSWMALGLAGLALAIGMTYHRSSPAGPITETGMAAEPPPLKSPTSGSNLKKDAPAAPKSVTPRNEPATPITGKSADPQQTKPVIDSELESDRVAREKADTHPPPAPALQPPVLEPPPAPKSDPVRISVVAELHALDADIEIARKKAQEPENEFRRKYRLALTKLRNSAQTAGNLKAVLAVDDAMASIDGGQQPSGQSSDPAVKELEKIYLDKLPAVQTQTETQTARLIDEAASARFTRLNALISEMVRQGAIQEAKTAGNLVDQAKAKVDAERPISVRSAGSAKEPAKRDGVGKSMGMLPQTMRMRCSRSDRLRRLKDNGGSPACEESVVQGLRWLKTHQSADGSWGITHRTSMTGMALLAYFGHCETPASEEFGDSCLKGITYLVDLGMKNNGKLGADVSLQPFCYEHAIASYALAEAAIFCKDLKFDVPNLLAVTEKAGQFIIDNQHKNGGWAYGYATHDGHADVSVVGWQVQALKACSHTALKFRGMQPCISKALAYLASCQHESGGYGYTGTRDGERDGYYTLTGVGMLCHQLWGKANNSDVRKAAKYVLKYTKFDYNSPYADLYAHYYESQAMMQLGGDEWKKYNDMFHDQLVSNQEADGSWKVPGGGMPLRASGTEYMTNSVYRACLCTLMLEVYYRFIQEGRSTVSTPAAPDTVDRTGSAPRQITQLKGELDALQTSMDAETAKSQAAVNTINRLTNNKRTSVTEGSSAYHQCAAASLVIREAESNTLSLKTRKAKLEAMIRQLESKP